MQPKPPVRDDASSASWYSDVRSALGSPARPLQAGEQLAQGRFVVERTLGQGAMGVVYAAYDQQRGRSVALKTLQLTSSEAVYALKQEFRALCDITHPNLVRLHELFVEQDRVFFSMDWVDGVAFDRCPPEQLEHALVQLVYAVQALHVAGKLHRDLKPANVMLQADGRLLVLDFGLVRDQGGQYPTHSGHSSDAQTGLVGTPRYMAPELLNWGKATQASDWYAVGVMLYETLTGDAPDAGGLARALQQRPPATPSSTGKTSSTQFDAICQGLLHPDPAQRADGEWVLAALGVELPAASVPSAAVSSTRLVGRATQLEALNLAFQRHVERGVASAMLLSGSSGMGKSALLREFLRRQAPVATVLFGRCHEQETVSHKAFDELMDALTRVLIECSTEEAQRILPAAESAPLQQLFPVLGRVPHLSGFADATEGVDPHALRGAAYAALRGVLQRLAQTRPLIIALDDLQWGDLDSARLLSDLFAGGERPECLVVLCYRSDEREQSECLQRLLTGSRCLADSIDVEELNLGQLAASDAQTLARWLLGVTSEQMSTEEQRRVGAVCHEAQGSPLLLHELAVHIAQHGYVAGEHLSLAEVVRARLASVSHVARQLFDLLCVAGTPLREGLLKVALTGQDTAPAVLQLEAGRLIRARTSRGADAVEVVHDGIRAAALAALDAARQCAAHEALARAHKSASSPDVEALARHYAGAQLFGEAAYWAQKAAARASASFAFDSAARLYRQALSWGDLDVTSARTVRWRLANALADAGRGNEAAPLFMQVAGESAAAESLECKRRASDQWLVTGNIEQGNAVLRDVFDQVGMKLPRGKFTALLSLFYNRCLVALRGTQFTPRAAEEVEQLALLRLDVCRAGWMLSFVSTLHGAALQARYLRLALEVGEPGRVAMGLGVEALHRSIEGDRSKSDALRARARELADGMATPQAVGFQQLVDGNCAYLAGQWETCSEAAERAEETLTRRCRGTTWELNTLRFFWGMSLSYQGRYRELRRRVGSWLVDAEDRGDLCAQAGFRLNAARSLCLADDDPARAHLLIEQGLREWSLPDFGVHRFLAQLARVQVRLYEGDSARAVQNVKQLWSEFRISSMRRVQLARVHLRALSAFSALAAAAQATGTERARQLQRAARHQRKLERERSDWGNAQARYVAGQLALFQGDKAAAARHLEQAAQELQQCGMHALAAAARYRLGLVQGAAEQVAAAQASVRAQGVQNPIRFLSALAPGL